MAQAQSPTMSLTPKELLHRLMEKDRQRMDVVYETLCQRIDICATIKFQPKFAHIYDLCYNNNNLVQAYQNLMHEYQQCCIEVRTNHMNVSTIERIFNKVIESHSRLNDMRNRLIKHDIRTLDEPWTTIIGPNIVSAEMGKKTKVIQEYHLFRCPITNKVELRPHIVKPKRNLRWAKSVTNIDTFAKAVPALNSKQHLQSPPVQKAHSLEDTPTLEEKLKLTFNGKIQRNKVYQRLEDPNNRAVWKPANPEGGSDQESRQQLEDQSRNDTPGTPWIRRRSPLRSYSESTSSSNSNGSAISKSSNHIPGLSLKAKLRSAKEMEGSFITEDSSKELNQLVTEEIDTEQWEYITPRRKQDPSILKLVMPTPYEPKTPVAENRLIARNRSRGFIFYRSQRNEEGHQRFTLLEKRTYNPSPAPVVSNLQSPLSTPPMSVQDPIEDEAVIELKNNEQTESVDKTSSNYDVDYPPIDKVDTKMVEILTTTQVTGPPGSPKSPFSEALPSPLQEKRPQSDEDKAAKEKKLFTYATATSIFTPDAPGKMQNFSPSAFMDAVGNVSLDELEKLLQIHTSVPTTPTTTVTTSRSVEHFQAKPNMDLKNIPEGDKDLSPQLTLTETQLEELSITIPQETTVLVQKPSPATTVEYFLSPDNVGTSDNDVNSPTNSVTTVRIGDLDNRELPTLELSNGSLVLREGVFHLDNIENSNSARKREMTISTNGRLMSKFDEKESILHYQRYKLSKEYPDIFNPPSPTPHHTIKDSRSSDIQMTANSFRKLNEYSTYTPIEDMDSVKLPMNDTILRESLVECSLQKKNPTTSSWDTLTEIKQNKRLPLSHRLNAAFKQSQLIQGGKVQNKSTVDKSVGTQAPVLQKVKPVPQDFTNTGARPKTSHIKSIPVEHSSELPKAANQVVEPTTHNHIPQQRTVLPVETGEMQNDSTQERILEEQFESYLQNMQITAENFHRKLSAEIKRNQTTLQRITDDYKQNLTTQLGQAQTIITQMRQNRIRQRNTKDELCQLFDKYMQFQ